MNLTKLTMRRPVSVLIIVLALIVFGIQSMFSAPLELIPEMELPMMLVITNYPGAGPEEVDELVGSVIESAVSTLQGVEDVYSQSQEGSSMVQLMMSYGTNMDMAHTDLQKRIDMYKGALPENAMDPMIIEMSMDMQATISLSVQATGDIDLLNYVEETIKPEFEKLGSVASVEVSGGQKDYISIQLREEDMKQYNLTIENIAQYIAMADFSMPAGSIERGSSELNLRGGVTYNSTDSLRNMPIMLPTGGVIKLTDVADVFEAKKEATSIYRYNGTDTVNINVNKRQSASTIDVSRSVKKAMERLNAQNLGVQISVVSDSSIEILAAIKTVITTLLLGILLSMFVLFLFFGEWKASIIVGSSMPISVLATLIIMEKMGFSFNLISLGGLVIGVGMMVDNSIVVLESCFRCRSQQLSTAEAALEGTQIVTSSIIASTLTTIVVFLPIATMKGMTGQLFTQLGYTIIFALTASLISALTLVPLVFMRMQPKEKDNLWMTRKLNQIGESYGRFLQKTFKHKKMVVVTAVVLLIIAFASLSVVHMELIPSIDQGAISISVKTRPGLNLTKVDEISKTLEQMVSSCDDVDHYSLSGGGNGISVSVYLKKDRKLSTAEVVDLWREQTQDTVDYTVSVSSFNMADMMSGGGSVQVVLKSTDKEQLKLAANQVVDLMESSDSIISASSSLSDGSPQAEIVIDPIKANAAGLMPAQIISSVSSVMNGKNAASMRQNGREYELWVEYPKETYGSITDLAGFTITNPMGYKIPLLDVAEIKYSNSPQTILKMNNQYTVTITGQPTTAAKVTANTEIMAKVAQMKLPEGVSFMGGFSNEAMMEEFSAMGNAILAAVFLVFMVMAMQFESVKFSLVVMMCIPFSLIGSFGALALSGVTLSMPSLMGLLMLVGIVINNGILFIDTANRYRTSMDAETALVYAGKTRMRPILMTTLTTVLSMLPMALGIGEGAEIMQGMAVIIIGGLCASTLLTLLLLPAFYLLMNKDKKDKKKKRNNRKKVKENQLPPAAQEGTYDVDFISDDSRGNPPILKNEMDAELQEHQISNIESIDEE